MPDKNDFSEVIADMLIKQDKTNELLTKVVDRLTSLNEKTTNLENHAEDQNKKSKRITEVLVKAVDTLTGIDKRLNNVENKLDKIDDRLEHLIDIENRLKKLEKAVFGA